MGRLLKDIILPEYVCTSHVKNAFQNSDIFDINKIKQQKTPETKQQYLYYIFSNSSLYLSRFAGSCQSLLVLVYDGLMLPLPPALSPPSSPVTPHSNTSSESVSEEDDWSNHRSLGSKPSTLDTNSSQPSRVYVLCYEWDYCRALYLLYSLTRCNSFHGLQTQRQIVVKRNKKDSSNVS